MNKREMIRLVLEGKQPPYVPWSFGFTVEAKDKLKAYYAPRELEDALDNHSGCMVGYHPPSSEIIIWR